MFERRHQPLLTVGGFVLRMLKAVGLAAAIDGVTLAIGATGFRLTEGVDWTDACLNAALVATGNGASLQPQSVGGKIFLLCFALAGVIVFAAVISTVMAPILHRTLHAFHADVPDGRARAVELRDEAAVIRKPRR